MAMLNNQRVSKKKRIHQVYPPSFRSPHAFQKFPASNTSRAFAAVAAVAA